MKYEYTYAELKNEMSVLENTFSIVRLVDRSFIMREGRDFNISSLFGDWCFMRGLGVKSFRRGRLWCR